MRLIGTLPEQTTSECFRDYLYSQGIEAQVDPGREAAWEVWVLHDDDVDRAESMLTSFQADPEDPRFMKGARAGSRQQQRERKRDQARRFRTIDSSRAFYRAPVTLGMVTFTLMAISIGVAVVSRLGQWDPLVQWLSITGYERAGGAIEWMGGLPEVRHGQIWRLATPMFLHFSILHILFNMLWMRDLGSVIEARRGSVRLLVMVLVIAVISNLSQYLVSGPSFGGMSGVVYGLLGYIWMQGKIHPAGKLVLRPQIVTMMLVWLFICMTGLVGPIANTAHVVGLLVGIAWGAIAAFRARWRRSF